MNGWKVIPDEPAEAPGIPEYTIRPSVRVAFQRAILALFGLWALMIPFVIGALVGDGDTAGAGAAIFGVLELGGTIVVPILVSFGPAVQIMFTRYTVDAEGIRERVQILSKTERRVQWAKVTALQHRRTILDKIMGIERLDVIAYGERGATIHLVGLRDAAPLRNLVARQMRAEASVGSLFAND